jgi:hypothetical protein
MGFNSRNTNGNVEIKKKNVAISRHQRAETVIQEEAQLISSSCRRHAENKLRH